MTDLLFIFSHSPYAASTAKEGLEATLAAGAFDQDIGVLFTGDGVWQLTKNHETSNAGRKNHQKMTQALPMFGIEKIFIDEASITERGLNLSELTLSGQTSSQEEVQSLMASAKHIISF